MERTTNIRVDKQLQSKLVFLTRLTGKNMSEIIEALVDKEYPTIQEDMAKLEKTERDIAKRLGGGNGGK